MQSMKKRRGITSLEMRVFPYILIAPNFLLFQLFGTLPALFGVYYSLPEWSGIGEPVFVGMENYLRMMQDTKFWESMLRTCVYVVISLPLIMAVPLLLASMLVKEIRARGLFRAIFYWPSMISYIVVGISFKFIFGDNTGIINYLLELFGQAKIGWLTENATAMAVVILATVWSRSGCYMITYISGLQSIPESYYEAAEVDGASGIRQFFRITLPLLKPTTFLVMILALIAVQYIYEQAFLKQNLGYASTLSMVLFGIMAVITMIQFYVNKGGAVGD